MISRLITGVTLILLGIGLTILSFFSTLFLLIYGAVCIILGLFILFNKKEDKIEERKDLKQTENLR